MKDKQYWIIGFDDNRLKETHYYKSFNREIKSHGYFSLTLEGIGTAKIYTPELATILCSEKLLVFDRDTKTEITINPYCFHESYLNGFMEGEQYFDKEFAIPVKELFGANAEPYVNTIHYNYFHAPLNGSRINRGWNSVKSEFPITFNQASIKQFGFLAGIVSKVDEMVLKYPTLFLAYEKECQLCEPGQVEPKPQLTLRQIALKHCYEGKSITKKEGGKLYQHYTKYLRPGSRTKTEDTKRKSQNKIELIESVIAQLTDSQHKQKATDELSILKAATEKDFD